MTTPLVDIRTCRVQGAYKLSEDFAKPYFHKYWREIRDFTTIWKFHSDLKCIWGASHVWHGRCPGDTAIPTKPSQACLVWRSQLRCWCALAILVVSFVVVGRKHCPWRNPQEEITQCQVWCWGDQVQKVLSVAAALPTHRPGSCSFRYPEPPYVNVVGPRLVGKCTPVPPHTRVVALTNSATCPGTPFQ